MNAGSLLEIYTTMFGWSVYNTMYDLFSATGLLVFPFLMMIIRNWKEPMQSQNDKAASVVSQARVNVDGLSMMAVFMLAVVPFSAIDLNQMSYRVACTNTAGGTTVKQNVVGGSTGTTYDAQLASINNVQVPVLWWLVTSIGSGVNAAISTSFICFEDIKGLDMQLRNLTIKDQGLRSEYSLFANRCYLPAKSKYALAKRGGLHNEYVEQHWNSFLVSSRSGVLPERDDWMFIGSHFYQETDGFYKAFDVKNCSGAAGCGIKSQYAVKDWPINQSRDFYPDGPDDLINNPDPNKPLYGKPYCDEWWNDDVRGIKNKLLASIESTKNFIEYETVVPGESLFDKTKRWAGNAYTGVVNAGTRFRYTDEQLEDMIINNYVTQDPPSFRPDNGGMFGGNSFADIRTNSPAQNLETGVSALVGAGAAALTIRSKGMNVARGLSKSGSSYSSQLIDFYTNMFIAKQAAPMVQAILLMLIYMFLLVYMVMSNYDIDATIQLIFIILGIQFFTTIWNLADYLDAQLFVSMHPNATYLGSIYNMGPNRLILDIVLTLLYVVGPFIFLWVMNMAGSKVSSFGASLGSLGKAGNTKGAGAGINQLNSK